MPPGQYEAFFDNLVKSFPGYAAYSGAKPPCFLPECSGAGIKTVTTGEVCPVPKCLNIVSINNSGQFSGKIKVNQDGRCLAIKKGDGTNGTGTGTPTDERSLWDKYNLVIIISIIVFFLLLVLVGIFFVSSEDSKKKRQESPQLFAFL